MTPALIESKQKMRERQQRRVLALQRSLERKHLAALFDVDVSNFNAVMSESSHYMLSAYLSEGLLAVLASLHMFEFIEELLPPGFCVARIPEGTVNGRFEDELLDGQETLGDTSRAIKHGDLEVTRAHGRRLVDVGARIEAEAAAKLRQINGTGLFE